MYKVYNPIMVRLSTAVDKYKLMYNLVPSEGIDVSRVGVGPLMEGPRERHLSPLT